MAHSHFSKLLQKICSIIIRENRERTIQVGLTRKRRYEVGGTSAGGK